MLVRFQWLAVPEATDASEEAAIRAGEVVAVVGAAVWYI
jgi:hypothetical protein